MEPGHTGVPMDMNPEPRLAFLQCLSLPPFLLDRHTKPNLVAGKSSFISIRIFSGPTEIMILSPVLHLRESFVEHCQLQNQDIDSHPWPDHWSARPWSKYKTRIRSLGQTHFRRWWGMMGDQGCSEENQVVKQRHASEAQHKAHLSPLVLCALALWGSATTATTVCALLNLGEAFVASKNF